MGGAIVLFDGVCNLCTRSVQFLIKHDPDACFRFASLQSPAGERLLRERGIDTRGIDSIILIHGDAWNARSDAALEIARQLSGAWRGLVVFKIVPRPIRDAV